MSGAERQHQSEKIAWERKNVQDVTIARQPQHAQAEVLTGAPTPQEVPISLVASESGFASKAYVLFVGAATASAPLRAIYTRCARSPVAPTRFPTTEVRGSL